MNVCICVHLRIHSGSNREVFRTHVSSLDYIVSNSNMALRRFNAGGKKQKELTEEQKQEIKEAFDLLNWQLRRLP